MKFIKRIIIISIVVLILAVALIVGAGYLKYKNAIKDKPLKETATEIMLSENYTKLEDISPTFVDAMVSVEDKRFFNHKGIDFMGVMRALKVNIESKEAKQGGSSITQQLAKNMYFISDNTLTRKIAEIFLTIEIEKTFSKQQILELYFNTIYYGSGYYNIYDASMGYFGKEPSELTDFEATLLAGIPNAPSVYSLNNNPDLAKQRQKQVVRAMVKNNKLTKEEADAILSQQ